MNDWKEQLNLKEKEFNLTKGGKDGQDTVRTLSSDRVNSGRSNNSIVSNKNTSNSSNIIGSGSRNLFRGNVSKEINNVNKKEEKVMITKDAALEDLEKIDVNAPVGKVIVEVGRILIKILVTIRSNQLLSETDKVKIREIRKARDAKKETSA